MSVGDNHIRRQKMMTYDLAKAHQAQLLREAEQAYLIEAFKHTKTTAKVQRQWHRFFLAISMILIASRLVGCGS